MTKSEHEYIPRPPHAAQRERETTPSDVSSQTAETVRSSVVRLDQRRRAATESLDQAASTVRDRSARISNETIRSVATRTADALESAAAYLRETDASRVIGNMEAAARTHPFRLAAIALAMGYTIGKVIRR